MARRSLLFSPGDRSEMLREAAETDADVLCFDLEDGVAPDRKGTAREAVSEVLSDPDFDPDAEVCVRLGANAMSDVGAVVGADTRLDAVVVSKAERAADVEAISGLLLDAGRSIPAFALIESAAGVLAAKEVAAADPTVAVCFGAEDLAADLGATPSDDRSEVSYARQHVLLAARAAGVDAIDAVQIDYEDEAALRADAQAARDLGYDGKMAIHPAQVPVINEAFTPDDDRIEWAERILDAYEEAEAAGRGAFSVDGEMVDAPVVAQAERVLARADETD